MIVSLFDRNHNIANDSMYKSTSLTRRTSRNKPNWEEKKLIREYCFQGLFSWGYNFSSITSSNKLKQNYYEVSLTQKKHKRPKKIQEQSSPFQQITAKWSFSWNPPLFNNQKGFFFHFPKKMNSKKSLYHPPNAMLMVKWRAVSHCTVSIIT